MGVILLYGVRVYNAYMLNKVVFLIVFGCVDEYIKFHLLKVLIQLTASKSFTLWY